MKILLRAFRKLWLWVLAASLSVGLVGCISPSPHTVFTPSSPSGPSAGEVGQLLTFSTGASSCSRGHPVEYRFDWGDGSYSSWSSAPTASKIYQSAGTYHVRAQARCAVDPTVSSDWSPSKVVTITGTPSSGPVDCIPVGQLLDEFEANEIAARMKYEGKNIAVCGYVDSVRVNEFTGEPYVILAESPRSFRLRWVFCYFPPNAMPRLAQLTKGSFIVIRGYFDAYLLGSVFLKRCTLD